MISDEPGQEGTIGERKHSWNEEFHVLFVDQRENTTAFSTFNIKWQLFSTQTYLLLVEQWRISALQTQAILCDECLRFVCFQRRVQGSQSPHLRLATLITRRMSAIDSSHIPAKLLWRVPGKNEFWRISPLVWVVFRGILG